jgi:hypothetical protein
MANLCVEPKMIAVNKRKTHHVGCGFGEKMPWQRPVWPVNIIRFCIKPPCGIWTIIISYIKRRMKPPFTPSDEAAPEVARWSRPWSRSLWLTVIWWKPVSRHPVDGWCAGGCWVTLAHKPPLKPLDEASLDSARYKQWQYLLTSDGRCKYFCRVIYWTSVGREREIETERQKKIFVKTWPEMRRKRSPCWVGLCKPRNTESGLGRALSPWTSWFVRRGTGKWGSWSLEAQIMPQLALKLPTVKERS